MFYFRSIKSVAVTLALLFGVCGLTAASAFDDWFAAVKLDNEREIAALLQRGVDPNTIEPERFDTGLILALREDSMKVFRLLVEQPGINLEAKARNGDTALMIAAYKGRIEAAKILLAKKVQVNRPDWTPLHYAAAGGHNTIVKMLLERHAYIDAESPNKTTPIMMAAYEGHIHTVKLLLDEGADLRLQNELGMTALNFAERADHQDIVEGLRYQMSLRERQGR
jgi:uncharacterized protein